VAVGPLGGVHAGGAAGARVTTPAGRTYSTGRAGAAGVGPYGGVRAGAVGGAAYRGPYGGGYTVGRGTRYWSPAYLGTRGAYVRRGFVTPVFNTGWYRAHPAAWVAPRWRVANYWAAPAWASVAAYCGIAAAPIVYDYGATTVIENNYVYVNGEAVGDADQYAAQAAGFADRGQEAKPGPDQEWQPLGVFAVVREEEEQAQHVFQLAVDRSGIVRGNYFDALVDTTMPVYGSVDPQSQRVAWSVGDKKTVVFETGLNNLTLDETTVLVHYGNEQTVQMALVRLNEPAAGQ
jgi:hypothetical protein